MAEDGVLTAVASPSQLVGFLYGIKAPWSVFSIHGWTFGRMFGRSRSQTWITRGKREWLGLLLFARVCFPGTVWRFDHPLKIASGEWKLPSMTPWQTEDEIGVWALILKYIPRSYCLVRLTRPSILYLVYLFDSASIQRFHLTWRGLGVMLNAIM